MIDTTITFTKEQIETLCLVCSFYRSAMDKHSFAKGDVDKVKELIKNHSDSVNNVFTKIQEIPFDPYIPLLEQPQVMEQLLSLIK